VPERYEVRNLTPDLIEAAASLLAERHRRHRLNVPALDPAFEDRRRCESLIAEQLSSEGGHGGAMAFRRGQPAGYILFTSRSTDMWGPNAWAEDTGNAGEAEAIRECYAAVAGALVDAGIRGHWAMVPASDPGLIDGWFSLGFGKQHDYAWRAPVGTDFQPSAGDDLTIRRPTKADIKALAELDVVLPNHLVGAPVFSTLKPHTVEESAQELEEDLDNTKYSFWVAEHEGRVVSTLVGTSIHESHSWGPTMKPASAGFLGYAATLPDARGLGAGRALTDVFMAWARDEDFEWLTTDWRSGNLEANRTWRSMGFEPHFLRLYRHIS
jgi:GNAT superfamily N-acetyltransferase